MRERRKGMTDRRLTRRRAIGDDVKVEKNKRKPGFGRRRYPPRRSTDPMPSAGIDRPYHNRKKKKQ